MLEEAEKLRIQLEEQYRREVRDQLDQLASGRNKKSSLWAFFNSAFALWFLSSVVLGALGFLYSRWDKEREAQRTKSEQIATVENQRLVTVQRLDAEISSRLNYFNRLLSAGVPESERKGKMAAGLMALERPLEASYPVGVFPDYANRSFQSLLWELGQNVPKSEKPFVDVAYAASKELPSIYLFESRRMARDTTERKDFHAWLFDFPDLFEPWTNRSTLAAFNLDRWGNPLNDFLMQGTHK